jgi:hypothetical protein
VARMTPSRVNAGLVIVGESERFTARSVAHHHFREAEMQHLHQSVGADVDVCRLQVAMDDAARVRRFERFGNLARDANCLVEWNSASGDFDPSASSLHRTPGPPDSRPIRM